MTESPYPTIRVLATEDPLVPVREISHWVPVSRYMLEGPTPEEREQAAQWAAERQAEIRREHQRHADLVATHAGHPILCTLLAEHAPHENSYSLECHGCPENSDREYGAEFMGWPCPTWTAIANGGKR